ncbi:MAG TPA: hypothetical protein EYO33_11650 [Phycisphaerales bacterium]|nr:hypothetical protein [Phycisphaerales bacterium]
MKTPLILLVSLLLSTACLAQNPVALITKIQGKATSQGQELQLLGYVQSHQNAILEAGSQVVFSYIKGGLRATAVGPCTVSLKPGGPELLKGSANQLSVLRPESRRGAVLPDHLDLGSGGHLRRGELALHISGKLLPGEQTIVYSALPSFTRFRLTVSNSSTFEDVYESDDLTAHSVTIPQGKLEPGQTYDFLLQGSTETGQNMEAEKQGVVVLSQDVADKLEALQDTAESSSNFEAQTELLAVYLKYGLDLEALDSVQKLLQQSQDDRLEEIKNVLLSRLEYKED